MSRKLSLSSCDEWLYQFYLVFRSLSRVLLQLVNSAVVVGSGVNNNNDFLCANILEDQAQWRDKTKGLSNCVNVEQCVSR